MNYELHPSQRRPPSRKQRSCFTAVGIISVLFFGGILWALREHARTGGEAALSESELVEYKRWVDTPLDLPKESLVAPPLPTVAFLEQRQQLLSKAIQVRNSITTETWIRIEPCVSEDRWDYLSLDETMEVYRAVPPLLAEAKSLAQSPHYSFPPRIDIYEELGDRSYEGMECLVLLLSTYVKLMVAVGDLESGLDAYDGMLGMLHREPYVHENEIFEHNMFLYRAIDAGEYFESGCNDATALLQLLNLLDRHKEKLIRYDDKADLLAEDIRLAVRMKADGYKDELDLTPRALVSLDLMDKWHYQEWLAQNIAHDDPRVQAGIVKIDKDGRRLGKVQWDLIILNRIFGVLSFGVDHKGFIWRWQQLEKREPENLTSLYDDLRARVAEKLKTVAADAVGATAN